MSLAHSILVSYNTALYKARTAVSDARQSQLIVRPVVLGRRVARAEPLGFWVTAAAPAGFGDDWHVAPASAVYNDAAGQLYAHFGSVLVAERGWPVLKEARGVELEHLVRTGLAPGLAHGKARLALNPYGPVRLHFVR